jgi:predicted HAD superfamily Cof-like phosphohydrolase
MKDFAENVAQFNEIIINNPRPPKKLATEDQMSFTVKCLLEEIMEYKLAHKKGDYIGSIDALIDLMYFAIGGLHRMGLTPDEMAECGRIVHDANMTKKRGVVDRRATGDVGN